MATFNEIYQSYLQNPYAGVNAIAPVQGIGSLTNPMTTQPISGVGGAESTTESPEAGVGLKGMSIGQAIARLAQVVSLPFSPVPGIIGFGIEGITGKTPMQAVMSALGMGGGIGPTTGVDQGVGPGGCDPGSSTDQGVGPGGCSMGGGGDSGGPGGGDAGTGPGGCGYATGGRVGFSNGSSGQDYWITVQEMYDNAGGEAGTGLGLIDFANKYFPKMATGGRAGYLQGGLVSLLR